MIGSDLNIVLEEWFSDCRPVILKNKSLCIAVFSDDRRLLYANDSISEFFKTDPASGFLNPEFGTIVNKPESDDPVFEGFITIGDYSSINASLWSQVYHRNKKMLMIGGVIASSMVEQNTKMLHLNREISNVQRELIREKRTLEKTLEQLNQANTELKKVNADKDRFLSIMSHDLRSPFGGIMNLSEFIYENFSVMEKEEIVQSLDILYKTARSTFNLLEELLMWSRSQRGKVPFNPEILNFRDICNQISEIFFQRIQDKNLVLNIAGSADIEIYADNEMLKTILRNLVSNAIKFTPSGGKITIDASNRGDDVLIWVTDTGVGITKENIHKLFDISQTHTTDGTNEEKGTGLGLLLCKEFVDKHGGNIYVESEAGKGSVFSFSLPLKGR